MKKGKKLFTIIGVSLLTIVLTTMVYTKNNVMKVNAMVSSNATSSKIDKTEKVDREEDKTSTVNSTKAVKVDKVGDKRITELEEEPEVIISFSTKFAFCINGEIIFNTFSTPQAGKEKVYFPLEQVVQEMGDKYEWNDKTITITQKDGTKIVAQIGKSTISVNDKIVPIATETINKVKVPIDVKLRLNKDNDVITSILLFENHLGYKVVQEKIDGKIYINVGDDTKIQKMKKEAEDKMTDEEKEKLGPDAVATDDVVMNAKWAAENLGFQNTAEGSAMYNPRNVSIHGSIISIGTGSADPFTTMFTYKAWTYRENTPWNKEIRPISKKLFNFYFPTEGDKFYNMIDGVYTGDWNEYKKYMETVIYYDNRSVYLFASETTGYLYMYIGDVGDRIVLSKDGSKFVLDKKGF